MTKLVNTTLLRWWVKGYLNGLPRYRSTKMAPLWLCLLFCLTGYEGMSQNDIRLGSGASVTGSQSASPVNIWYRSLNSQMIYTRAELNAAGISGAKDLTRLGFYIEEAPEHPLPDFTIRMKHTDSTDVSAHDPGPFTTVYTDTSYMPEEGGIDLLTLQTPFAWNGTDNILVEVCFDAATSFSATGKVRYYATSNGFRFSRSDDTSMCGAETATATTTKPQAKMTFCCYDDETGVIAIDSPAMPFDLGIEDVQVRFKNYGANTASGVTLHWSVNGVLQPPYNWSGAVNAGDTSGMIAIGAYNFDDKDQTYRIKVWTGDPNGNPDNFPANDTFAVSLSPGFLTADFAYRLPFTVYENADSNLTGYATLLTVNTADPVAQGKMQPNGKDVRFVQACHTNETLNYWIEGPMDDDSTKIWVNIPSLPASDSLTIYMLYGNPEASSAGSAEKTFIRVIDSVKAAWRFDEGIGGTTADYSGNSYDGTLMNGPAWVSGQFGNAVELDGTNDWVEAADFDVNNDFSISTWVNPYTPTVKQNIIGKHTLTGGNLFLFGFFGSPTNIHVRIRSSTSNNGTPSTGWQHFVVTGEQQTASTTEVTVYQDGVQIGQSVFNDVMGDLSGLPWTIGQEWDGGPTTGDFFDGVIDETRIYDKALTPDEVTDLYNNYGYVTTNYAGHELVRQYVSPEPTFRQGMEEAKEARLITNQPSDTICAGDTVTFHVPGNLTSYDFYVNGLLLQSGVADTFVAPSLSDGDTVRVVASGNGPCAGPVVDTAERVITVRPPLTADFSFTVNGLMVDFTNTSVSAETWTWDFGDTTTSTQDDPRRLYHKSGTYEACLMTSNSQCGLSDTLCQNVTVSGALSAHFSYALPVKIYENSGITLTDYPVAVTIDTDSLIAAGHMQPDGRDIRFTGNCMGDTVLNYWIEGPMDDESTKMWVNIPSLPASDSLTIYMLYGNPEVPPASSADKTFIRVIDSVKAAWRFDEGTGTATADHSGNNYDGTLMSPAWVSGQFENALDFDGSSDRVVTTLNTGWYSSDGFSYFAWINTTNTTRGVIAGDYGNTPAVSLEFGSSATSNNVVRAYLHDGSNVKDYYTNAEVNDGNWRFVGFTYNGSTQDLKLYIDGVDQGVTKSNDGTLSGDLYNPSRNVLIGSDNRSSPPYFNGLIDETRIYDKALTPDEITDLYNNYGYVTTNYAGHELVRPYMSPEPTFSLDLAEEEALSAILSVTPNKAAHCEGEAITFTATEGFSDYDFLVNGASVQAGPDHLYTTDNLNDGDVIEVYASKPDGCVMLDSSDQVSLTIDPQPASDYDYTVSDLTVTFNSLSTDADSLYWDFGDGQEASGDTEPVHTYTNDDTYTVCLTAFNACGADPHCADVEVPCNTPVADFSYTDEGLTLSFTNNTQHATTWRWDFGDDIGSNEEEPVHAFTDEGAYDICLTAMNGCDTTQSCQEVSVQSVSVEEPAAPLEVSIYPNPAGTYLTVEITGIAASEAVELRMFGMEGREVKPPTEISHSNRQVRAHINVSHLAEGFYLIRVVGESYILNEKVYVIE